MNQNKDITKLLQGYLNNTLSKEEQAFVEAYIENSEDEFDILMEDLWEDTPDKEGSTLISELRYRKLSEKLFQSLSWKNTMLRLAAMLVLILGCIYFFKINSQGDSDSEQFVIETNIGEQRKVVLPDGSMIWLNCKSALSYHGTSDKRLVHLKGEAFFEVFRDTLRPFIIETGSGDYTEVLGTSFNIKSYSSDMHSEIRVREGLVAVGFLEKGQKSVVYKLVKGEKARLDKSTQQYTKTRIAEDSSYESWMDGTLTFQNASLKQVKNELERWYDVQIIIEHQNATTYPEPNFTAVFNKETGLEELLESLSLTNGIAYSIDRQMKRVTLKYL